VERLAERRARERSGQDRQRRRERAEGCVGEERKRDFLSFFFLNVDFGFYVLL
jgi:hypothetical protein